MFDNVVNVHRVCTGRNAVVGRTHQQSWQTAPEFTVSTWSEAGVRMCEIE